MVAAFRGDHVNHDASLRVFAEADGKTGACSLHSLAEVHATMAALPVRPALAPEQVYLFVEQVAERLTPIALRETEYLRAIREIADRGLTSGSVYNALLLACARKSRAEVIYTWNLGHFLKLAPDLADRIRTP